MALEEEIWTQVWQPHVPFLACSSNYDLGIQRLPSLSKGFSSPRMRKHLNKKGFPGDSSKLNWQWEGGMGKETPGPESLHIVKRREEEQNPTRNSSRETVCTPDWRELCGPQQNSSSQAAPGLAPCEGWEQGSPTFLTQAQVPPWASPRQISWRMKTLCAFHCVCLTKSVL